MPNIPTPYQTLQITYPTINHVRFQIPPGWRERDLLVRSVRDLVFHPLTIDEFRRRPYIRRGRYLIRATEANQWRQFYLSVSREFYAPGTLWLALYKAESTRPCDLLYRPFSPHHRDIQRLLRLLDRLEDRDFGNRILRIIAADMEIA